jgi:signal transduction histidine kinase
MRDRLEALGGSLNLTSEPGKGTTVEGRLPLAIAVPEPALV